MVRKQIIWAYYVEALTDLNEHNTRAYSLVTHTRKRERKKKTRRLLSVLLHVLMQLVLVS